MAELDLGSVIGPTGPQGETGPQGPQGVAGKSAYAAAQDGGYSGTEGEFNAQLAAIPDLENGGNVGDVMTLTSAGAAWAAARGVSLPVPITDGGTGQQTEAAAVYALINALETLTPSTIAAEDFLPMLDTSDTTGKKIPYTSLQSAIASYVNTTYLSHMAKIELVTYMGTGTYGSSNPNTVTFSFAPKIVLMLGKINIVSSTGELRYPEEYLGFLPATPYGLRLTAMAPSAMLTSYYQGTGFEWHTAGSKTVNTVYGKKSANEKSFTWYSTESALAQCNDSAWRYSVLAIG